MKPWAITVAIVASGALAQNPSVPVPPGQTSPTPAQPAPAAPKQDAGAVFKVNRYPDERPQSAAPADEPKKALLTYDGKPMKVPFECPEADIAAFGMTCSEKHPCPVYMEITSLQPLGQKIFVTGNFHNGESTMYSLLLTSEDAGKTWTEPMERVKSGGLDQIQFLDFENGWISGAILGAMPRDPFFLLTNDGGKSWRKRPVFSEPRVAAIDHFVFQSKTAGQLIIDRTQGAETPRFEHHESMTGGESWSIKEVSPRTLRLAASRAAGNADWRVRSDGKVHHIEKRAGAKWDPVSDFFVIAGACKPTPVALVEPPPAPDPPPPPPARKGAPASRKKK